ncbi:MAG: YheU family protein [Pseudomonadota bacterium]
MRSHQSYLVHIIVLIIPTDRLSAEAVLGLIEEFVSREGTDYGQQEFSFEQKCAHVQRQLASGGVIVVFDAATDSCNLVSSDDLLPQTTAGRDQP